MSIIGKYVNNTLLYREVKGCSKDKIRFLILEKSCRWNIKMSPTNIMLYFLDHLVTKGINIKTPRQ